MLMLHPGSHETQGIANAIANFHALLPAALVGNAMSGKSETGGSDAGDIALICAVSVAAIFYQPSSGIGLVPKELEAGAFNTFQEFIFVTSEAVLCRVVLKQRRPLGRLLRLGLRALRPRLRTLRRRLRTLQEFGN